MTGTHVRGVLHAVSELPVAVDTALAIIGVGLVVFAAIAYDVYRQLKP